MHSPTHFLKRSVFRVVLLLLLSHHLSLLWQTFMMCCVNKTTHIHLIDGRCHIKQLKAGKNHKTCLTNHTWSMLHHITPFIINTLGGRHTHIPTCKPMQFQETRHALVCSLYMSGLKILARADLHICGCLNKNLKC